MTADDGARETESRRRVRMCADMALGKGEQR